ncbi:hypothetical protein TNCV_1764921 [Trichonephila clavipes]|nr:hypothetical protein TNCV_1764921 [Trichonephila clavipes]
MATCPRCGRQSLMGNVATMKKVEDFVLLDRRATTQKIRNETELSYGSAELHEFTSDMRHSCQEIGQRVGRNQATGMRIYHLWMQEDTTAPIAPTSLHNC